MSFSFFTSACYSDSLDDITNYKKPEKAEGVSITPYTTEEIINRIASHLDASGVFQGGSFKEGVFFNEDPKTTAFNKSKFGNCSDFYVGQLGYGNSAFENILQFSFPKNEEDKENSSKELKHDLEQLENPRMRHNEGCENHLQYVIELREFLGLIAKTAPSILEKNQKKVESEKAKEKKLLAKDLERKNAELKANDENAKKLTACRQKPEYKLYEVSLIIQRNNEIARYSQKEIDSQNEGAKISGVVNKRVMYEAGNRIVGAKASNKEAFVSYKKLGGIAKTPETVVTTNNPCVSLEKLSGL